MKKNFVIFLTSILFISNFKFSYSNNLNELNKEKNDINNKTNEIKNDLNNVTNEKNTILEQVESMDKQLEKVQQELEKLNNQLSLTESKLAESEEDLYNATKDKEAQYEALKSRLRFMYEYGSTGYLEFLIDTKNFTDFFKRIEYINSIMEYDENLFQKYKETEEIIFKKVQEIKTQKENIETLRKTQKEKESEINSNILEKESLIKNLSSQEELYKKQIEELEKEDREITNLIQEIQKNQVASIGQSNNKIYATTSGQLEYPVPAYRGYKYNSLYGQRIDPISNKSSFHSGVDLKATLGTDIVAAENGTVIFSGNRGGYGKTVIIDHGNNMTTLYAHNSSLSVTKGQTVKRGQVIAKAGTTGYSTGVHAHFEVRINGKHVDPSPYIGH